MSRIDVRLRDIWERVHVDESGCRADVDGKPIEAETPRDLEAVLAVSLYETFHARRARDRDAFDGFTHIRDLDFESGFLEDSRGITTQQEIVPTGDHTAVIDGVRVRLPDEMDLSRAVPGRPIDVSLPGTRPRVTPGFFLVRSIPAGESMAAPLLRLYARIESPRDARTTWHAALDVLRGLRTAWQAKVLAHPAAYPRADALVVYLPRSSWNVVPDLARSIRAARDTQGPPSAFARALGDGITMAFEPDDRRPGSDKLSFGQHRTRLVASALVRTRGLAYDAYAAEIERLLFDAGVDPNDVSRNLSTPASVALGVHG